MQEEMLTADRPVDIDTDMAGEFAQIPSEEPAQPEAQAEMSELDSLKMERRGHFDIPSMTLEDLKWLRTFLTQSVEFTGPNEAFVILQNHNMILAEVENQKRLAKMQQEASAIRLPSACVESCLYFLNKAKFTGINNAQSLFKVSFQLNNAYSKIHDLDTRIKALEDASKTEETKSSDSEK